MALPEPEAGLVISYSYLWHDEGKEGQEEGRKERPCVIVRVAKRAGDGTVVVTVLPVTHRPPKDSAAAIEIPQAIKRHLELDLERSWIAVHEGNKFVWPGYDLRKTPGKSGFAYGFLPPRFFRNVIEAFGAWHRSRKSRVTSR